MSKILKFILIILLVLLITSAIIFLLSTNLTQTPTPEEVDPDTEVKTDVEDVEELTVETLKEGDGEKAELGDRLTVHYEGRLLDGEIFDSSYNRDQPFEFKLGEGKVIEGWEEGLEGIREGEKIKLKIPSEKGYGEQGSANIPPNAGLEFEIELINIE